jgi:hypothetical protein
MFVHNYQPKKKYVCVNSYIQSYIWIKSELEIIILLQLDFNGYLDGDSFYWKEIKCSS